MHCNSELQAVVIAPVCSTEPAGEWEYQSKQQDLAGTERGQVSKGQPKSSRGADQAEASTSTGQLTWQLYSCYTMAQCYPNTTLTVYHTSEKARKQTAAAAALLPFQVCSVSSEICNMDRTTTARVSPVLSPSPS